MLFQGQEFAASAPFHYFADHTPELAKLVADGRRKFLQQFPSIACAESNRFICDPESEETFRSCKLDLSERERHVADYRLHRDLLQLRRSDPVFHRPRTRGVDGAVLGEEAFVLRFFGGAEDDRLLLVNLGSDLKLESVAEPLLAPPRNATWKLQWSSEAPEYGGNGTPTKDDGGLELTRSALEKFAIEKLSTLQVTILPPPPARKRNSDKGRWEGLRISAIGVNDRP